MLITGTKMIIWQSISTSPATRLPFKGLICYNVIISPQNCWNVEAVLAVWVGHCTCQVLPRFRLAPCIFVYTRFPKLKFPGESDLYTAQAGDGIGRSHWHAGYPISKAVSSKPKIRSCDRVAHIIYGQATFGWNIWTLAGQSAKFFQTQVESLSKCQRSKYQLS